jgi:hypothetical protein
MDGVDDLAAVDPFEVDAGDPEVRVPELALDDDQRNALSGHLRDACERGNQARPRPRRCCVNEERHSGLTRAPSPKRNYASFLSGRWVGEVVPRLERESAGWHSVVERELGVGESR